ncbi:MAG: ATP-binding cassette domain-containing protein [Acidimicrobiia bacterium]|nr:ATP-binding cassette domain-containing protein [Acidimicrobiia bacterium]
MAVIVEGLTKTFGDKVAVGDLDMAVEPGLVTGFLGPNGAGKSTTMRMMLGIDRSDRGNVTFDGTAYTQLDQPARMVGAMLDAHAVDPDRSARSHLSYLAAASGLPATRVDEVLGLTGIREVAKRHVGAFSLGMHQRLGIASAMLGDPKYLFLDEPTNGLDPEGIRWVRQFLQELARQGRGILVSSHLLAELSLYADQLVVIGRGRLITTGSVDHFRAEHATITVTVRSPGLDELVSLIESRGGSTQREGDDLVVRDMTASAIGDVAALHSIPIHELHTESSSLEDAYLEVTAEAQQYRSGGDDQEVES